VYNIKTHFLKQFKTIYIMQVSNAVAQLSMIFVNNNFQLFVVGGAVRDFLLGANPKDFDLCTNANPVQVQNIIRQNGGTCDLVGECFGVVIARIFGEEFEIASFRSDEKGVERQAITFKPATMLEDSERRDLTINAMFFDVFNNNLIDPQGGEKSIKSKTIETVGNARERFTEDPSRILRAIRFSEKLEFKLSQDIIETLNDFDFITNLVKRLPNEQKVKELFKILDCTKSSVNLAQTFKRFKLLEIMFPSLVFNFDNCKTNTQDIAQWLAMVVKSGADKLTKICQFPLEVTNTVLALQSVKTICLANFTKVVKFFKNNVSCFTAFAANENCQVCAKVARHDFSKEFVQELMAQGIVGAELGRLQNIHEFETFNK